LEEWVKFGKIQELMPSKYFPKGITNEGRIKINFGGKEPIGNREPSSKEEFGN